MRFKRLNIARKLFLMLLKRSPPSPLLWKIYLYENIYYIYQKFHDMNGFVKLRAVSKLSTFPDTPCISVFQHMKNYIFNFSNEIFGSTIVHKIY
jgi:hypothetical protein